MIYSGNNMVTKIRITGTDFTIVDQILIPGFDKSTTSQAEIRAMVKMVSKAGTKEKDFLPQLQTFLDSKEINLKNDPNGMYTALDKTGNYYGGWGTTIYKVTDVNKGDINSPLQIVKSIDIRNTLPKDIAAKVNRLLGLSLTYDGHIAVAMPGLVAIMTRDFTNVKYVYLEGEAIDNGISVDSDSNIYVVTSKYMRKIIWNGKTLSIKEKDGAWKSEYDYVPNPKALSRGAGNTPTLMGFGNDKHKFVIVADAGDPVKTVLFWRDEIPKDFKKLPGAKSRRIAAQVPLSIKVPATIEWSPHVYGYGVMMMASAFSNPAKRANGEWDLQGTVLTGGVTRAAPIGSEKFTWDPKTSTLKSSWTTDYSLQWGLSPVSSVNNIVNLMTLEDGVYGLASIDWTTGKLKGKTVFGKNPIFNVMGGFLFPLPNGDIYLTGGFGPVRVSKH
jgi:hypothetical protein